MSEALGSGWLVALFLGIPAFATAVLLPLARWIAASWRGPLLVAVKAKNDVQDRLDETLEKYAEERLQCMFLKAKVEAQTNELENWRSGRWTK